MADKIQSPNVAQRALESAREYVDKAIASYAGDPADNQFQKGFLAALEVVRDEAFAPPAAPVEKSVPPVRTSQHAELLPKREPAGGGADTRCSAGNVDNSVEAIARTICLSYGRDPDEMTSILEMCTADNKPVPIWQVYEEQAEAVAAKHLSFAQPQPVPVTGLTARGVGRMFDNEKAVLVMFDRKLTDDELRSLHDQIRILP